MQQTHDIRNGRVSENVSKAYDLPRIAAAIEGTVFHSKLHFFSSIDSTQKPAIAAAQADVEAGHVYVADEQTAGRGRGDHTWHSESGSGLTLSVLTRPRLPAEQVLHLSLAAGLAAQAAIRDVAAIEIDLRWPNDLVTFGANGKKVGGILTESAMQPNGLLRHAVIGIGINVNQPAIPEHLRQVATSLRMLSGTETSRDDLLISLLLHLSDELRKLPQAGSNLLQRFEAASTWVRRRRVHVAEGEGYTGITEGLHTTGVLFVRSDDGQRRTVLHGGVRDAL